MKPIRPSSAIHKSQTLRTSSDNFIPFHQGLLKLAKPIKLSRPQTAVLPQFKPSAKTLNPCLKDSKPLISDKEINEKLQECLKADFEMAQAQLNFHVHAEKIKANEQKKLLFENYEDSKKMLQDLTNDKIEFLKSQHKETLQSLSTQHKKAIEDLTKMFEERLSASELRFHKLEEDFRAVLDKKSKEFEEKNIDFEIERTKIHQNLKEYYRRKIEEELTLREKEEKLREKQLEERFEKQIANFFEKIRKEYEDQLSSYEIRLNQCENEKMEIEKMKNQLEEKLKHFIEKNFSNNYVQTEIIEIVQNKNNKIKMKNSEQNTEESYKITPEEKKLSTTELEETIIKIISSEERKNQENLIKNEKNEELQRIEKNKEFTHIIKNKISYEYDKDSNVFQEQEKNQLFVWDRELGTLINRLQDIIERKNQTLLEKNSQIDSLNALLQTYNDNYLSLISLKSC